VRKLVIAALVLAGLLVAADFGAAAAAEYQVAKQLREELRLAADPSVRINGFPFITQALSGHYSDVDMRAAGLSVGPLHDVAVEATLHDLNAPLSEVRAGDLQSVRADKVDARVRIKDKDIGRAIGIEDLRLQPASDAEIQQLLPHGSLPNPRSRTDALDAVRMVATTDLEGARTEVVGVGLIKLSGGQLRIDVEDVRLSTDNPGQESLPSEIRKLLIQALSTDVEPGGLPFAVTPTEVWVEPGTLVVEGNAEDASMGQAGIGVG
jgi:hypothetical protein